MGNNIEEFPYPEKEYQGWKNARSSDEDDSRQAYVSWRIKRDKANEESSARLKELFKESEERVSKLSPEKRKGLEEASRRHARKVRDEIYTSHIIRERKKKMIKNSDN